MGGGDDPSCPPLSLSLVGNFVAMGRGRRDPELAGFRLLGGEARGSPWSRRGRRCDCSGRPADASQPHAEAAAGSRTPQSSCVGASPALATVEWLLRRVAGTEVPGESSFRSRVPTRGLCRDKLLRVLRSSFRVAGAGQISYPLQSGGVLLEAWEPLGESQTE